ncbi:phosphodiesterase [Rhodococcus zopfii]|uniref:phosphodiesterase n=1 Tax=Rhodococcus zopfii TaxID=43772 RepID=UPI001111153F|nr:phosphodiesterase [Rhodococcus zopfii]
MKQLDAVLGAPFAVASAVRHARIFHPRGVPAEGYVELESSWWPVRGKVPVTVRLSRGIGLPAALPDVLGVAVRLHLADGPWDILLATANRRVPVFLSLARTWSSAHYSSITAFRTREHRDPRWVVAEPDAGQPESGAADALAGSGPLRFSLSLASAGGALTPAGRLVVETLPGDGERPAFDPVLHRPAGVDMWPRWIAAARRAAYRGSRAGRGAPSD